MSAPAPSRLDAGQVLQGAYDEATGRLRTDAEATIVNADISVELSPADDGVHIGDKTNGNTAAVDAARNLAVKDQASVTELIAVNTELDAQTVILSSIQSAVTGAQPLPTGAATEAKQDVGNASLSSIDTKIPAQIAGRLPVDTGLVQGLTDAQLRATDLDVNVTNQITGFATEATLASIDTKLDDLSVLNVGTIDGTPTGTQYVYVNNVRQQILAAHDRDQTITYADFGTKNQRITQVDYNSSTISPSVARKTITYTLISGRYRRDSINWSVI
jgi:hypothetical protein